MVTFGKGGVSRYPLLGRGIWIGKDWERACTGFLCLPVFFFRIWAQKSKSRWDALGQRYDSLGYNSTFPAGNRENNFQLSREGKLQVMKDLDREKEPYHSIIVKASSNRNWTPPRGHRAGQFQAWDLRTDLTLQEVRIFLEDINDQAPRFTKSEYTAGMG